MIYQPPAGARDLLPLEVAQKGWINDRLQDIFYRWGYQRIVTSTLEWLDTLMAGEAIERSTVLQIQNGNEAALGLRPELTASIARAAVTRMAGSTYPQRLCYRANVFRQPSPGHHGKQLEFYQAGVELLFAGGMLADAEILLLLNDCLTGLGLHDCHLILGEVGLTRSLLATFPPQLQPEIRSCIANLDYVTLENLPLEPHLKQQALLLFDLRGNPTDVLQKVASLDLDQEAKATVDQLQALLQLVDCKAQLPIVLDLSLLQTFDYYTGIVFEVVRIKDNQSQVLAQGGRYDGLLGLYHPQKQSSPGIGFSFFLEELHSAILSTPGHNLPRSTPSSDWLVVAKTDTAYATALHYAQNLRNSPHSIKVEFYLDDSQQKDSKAKIIEYAHSCRIKHIAWIDADGTPTVEIC